MDLDLAQTHVPISTLEEMWCIYTIFNDYHSIFVGPDAELNCIIVNYKNIVHCWQWYALVLLSGGFIFFFSWNRQIISSYGHKNPFVFL